MQPGISVTVDHIGSWARAAARRRAGASGLTGGPSQRILRKWRSLPLVWRLTGAATVGAALTGWVGWETAANRAAAPAHGAVLVRVVIIASLIAAGIYAKTSPDQARMGRVLIVAGLFSCLWLLNGSGDRLLFSTGVLVAGTAPVVFAYLLLAHPSGRLRSAADRWLLGAGALVAASWVVYVILTGQPPLKTGLIQCSPHCPTSTFSAGWLTTAPQAVKVPFVVGFAALVVGAATLLARRARSFPAALRRAVLPVAAVAVIYAVLVVAYLACRVASLHAASAIGAADVECAALVPVAILAGLGRQRLFMGQALATFVSQLARRPDADPQDMLADAIDDPSLRILYRRPGLDTYVDSSGAAVGRLDGNHVAMIERDGRRVAAVTFNRELSNHDAFIKAAGAAALIRLENTELEAALDASMADLRTSRARLVETSQSERRRLERDLHDGVQQRLVIMRIKLDQAADQLDDDVVEGRRALAAVGRQMDDALQELRALARGIYPTLLQEHGPGEALKAVARSSPVPTVIRALGVGRYPQETEVAVYFSCLEALQNVAKHAGPGADATVALWRQGSRLRFAVRDSGVGFDPGQAAGGSGLVNIRDRISAVGGTVTITSRSGHGTLVRGSVPAA